MTIDAETLMAYADGELDPLTTRRVERAIASDFALAAEVERHHRLRSLIAGSFAPFAEASIPDRLAALISSNVVAMPAPRPSPRVRWREAAALAACLVLGIAIGSGWPSGSSIVTRGDRVYASGDLAKALNTQLAANDGEVRVQVSFRERAGGYCRVFGSPAVDGIACRDASGWALRQTRAGSAAAGPDYRQAGSTNADLMAAAQDMMAGNPLDANAEEIARKADWQ